MRQENDQLGTVRPETGPPSQSPGEPHLPREKDDSLPRTAPRKIVDEPPPLRKGDLTARFEAAWKNIGPAGSLTEVDQAINAVKKALKSTLEELREDGVDSQVDYQLGYIFNALGSAVEGVIMAFQRSVESKPPTTPAAPGEPPGAPPSKGMLKNRSGNTWRRGGGQSAKRRRGTRGRAGAQKIGNGSELHGSIDAAAYAARRAESAPSSPPSPAELARNVVREALAHVETAFDTRMPQPEPVHSPWYEDDGLREIIQRLFGARGAESAASAWSIVDQMREMLAGQGVEVLGYDTEIDPEEQTDAFGIEDRANGRKFRYETDIPALAVRASDGGRQILGRGRALRVPVTDGDPEGAAGEGQ